MIKSKLKKIFLFQIMIVFFAFSNASGFEKTHDDLFYKIITNKNGFNEDITQIEFLVFLARALHFTDDLAEATQVNSTSNVPEWAEYEVKQVENKFGQLVPHYFVSFDPYAKLTKKTAIKFLYTYLEPYNDSFNQNSYIQYNIGFYTDSVGEKVINKLGIFEDDKSPFVTKLELSNALVKISQLKSERLLFTDDNTEFTDQNDIFQANFGASNNYIWRGIEQTSSGSPAVFGGIDIPFDNNFYLGSWVSNVEFEGDSATYEVDFYAGYSNSLSLVTDIGYDIGAIYYAYPDSDADDSIDFSEAYLSISAYDFTLSYYVLIEGQGDAAFADDSYLNLSKSFEINDDTTLSFAAGYFEGELNVEGEQFDFLVGLTKKEFTFSVITNNNDDNDPLFQIMYQIDI